MPNHTITFTILLSIITSIINKERKPTYANVTQLY